MCIRDSPWTAPAFVAACTSTPASGVRATDTVPSGFGLMFGGNGVSDGAASNQGGGSCADAPPATRSSASVVMEKHVDLLMVHECKAIFWPHVCLMFSGCIRAGENAGSAVEFRTGHGVACTGVHGGTDLASTIEGSECFAPGGTLRRTMEPVRRAVKVIFGAPVLHACRVQASVFEACECSLGGLGSDGAH